MGAIFLKQEQPQKLDRLIVKHKFTRYIQNVYIVIASPFLYKNQQFFKDLGMSIMERSQSLRFDYISYHIISYRIKLYYFAIIMISKEKPNQSTQFTRIANQPNSSIFSEQQNSNISFLQDQIRISQIKLPKPIPKQQQEAIPHCPAPLKTGPQIYNIQLTRENNNSNAQSSQNHRNSGSRHRQYKSLFYNYSYRANRYSYKSHEQLSEIVARQRCDIRKDEQRQQKYPRRAGYFKEMNRMNNQFDFDFLGKKQNRQFENGGRNHMNVSSNYQQQHFSNSNNGNGNGNYDCRNGNGYGNNNNPRQEYGRYDQNNGNTRESQNRNNHYQPQYQRNFDNMDRFGQYNEDRRNFIKKTKGQSRCEVNNNNQHIKHESNRQNAETPKNNPTSCQQAQITKNPPQNPTTIKESSYQLSLLNNRIEQSDLSRSLQGVSQIHVNDDSKDSWNIPTSKSKQGNILEDLQGQGQDDNIGVDLNSKRKQQDSSLLSQIQQNSDNQECYDIIFDHLGISSKDNPAQVQGRGKGESSHDKGKKGEGEGRNRKVAQLSDLQIMGLLRFQTRNSFKNILLEIQYKNITKVTIKRVQLGLIKKQVICRQFTKENINKPLNDLPQNDRTLTKLIRDYFKVKQYTKVLNNISYSVDNQKIKLFFGEIRMDLKKCQEQNSLEWSGQGLVDQCEVYQRTEKEKMDSSGQVMSKQQKQLTTLMKTLQQMPIITEIKVRCQACNTKNRIQVIEQDDMNADMSCIECSQRIVCKIRRTIEQIVN